MRNDIRRALVATSLVATLLVGAQPAAGQGGVWLGFTVSDAPGGDQQSWALGVTEDLGGPGVDIWNNNHALESFAIVDLGKPGQSIRTATQSGHAEARDTHGINFTDIDGDGDEDLIETSGRGSATRIFRNDDGLLAFIGDGGMPDTDGRGRQGAMVDIDLDGDMDLITTNLDRRSPPVNDTVNSPSDLWLNNGDGTSWTRAPDPNGAMSDGNLRIAQQTSTGPATPQIVITHASFALAIDSIGLGDTVMTEATVPATRRDYPAGTGFVRDVVLADFDGDLHPELLVVRGDGNASAGSWNLQVFDIVEGGSPRSAFIPDDPLVDNCRTATSGDYDNDGDIDILAGCAHPVEGQNRNILLRNDGVGNFSITGTDILPATGTETPAAAVTADIDGDGWLDAFVANGFDVESGVDDIYMNRGGTGDHWLAIDLVGANPDAAGAQVFVGTDKWQVRETGHRTHRSQDAKTLHFGLGDATAIAPIEIMWPDGIYQTCTVSGIDRRVTITKGSPSCQSQTRAGLLEALAAAPDTGPPPPPPEFCMGRVVTVSLAKGETPTNGDDVILGTAGADTIVALEGNDLICGLGGADVITAGPGNDRVKGDGGDDVIDGGPGRDVLQGGGGDDRIVGGTANDRISGNAGNDELRGSNGRDRVSGNSGRDTVYGGGGNDRLFAGGNRDVATGGIGLDLCRGFVTTASCERA